MQGKSSNPESALSWNECDSFSQFYDLAKTSITTFATTEAGQRQLHSGDEVQASAIFLMRDSLTIQAYSDAVKWADPGRLWILKKYMAFEFRGAGAHRYGNESLHELCRMLIELAGDEHAFFRKAAEASLFMNNHGVEGKSIGADLGLKLIHYWQKARLVFLFLCNQLTLATSQFYRSFAWLVAQGRRFSIFATRHPQAFCQCATFFLAFAKAPAC